LIWPALVLFYAGSVIMNASDQVRAYVQRNYIAPARKAGQRTVIVRAREVHKALKWDLKRIPQVCAALSARKFLRNAHLELLEKSGPPSGQSTTVEFTFRLLDQEATAQKPAEKPVPNGAGLEKLYGILKDAYAELGGAEAYLKSEKKWGLDVWERYEAEERARKEHGK
jgi:hypothetical protein